MSGADHIASPVLEPACAPAGAGASGSGAAPDQPEPPSDPGREPRRDAHDPASPFYTAGEEVANAVTHGVGVLLAVAGLVLLVVKAAPSRDAALIAAMAVFGASNVVEYLASTLYHAIWGPRFPRAKRVLRTLDHSCIYLLIAGSYTPYLLGPLAGRGGLVMFPIIWGLAAAGIGLELFARERQPRWVTVAIYLAMGWLVVFRLAELVAAVPAGCLHLLVAGGLCYSVGTGFYLLKRIPYMHSVWHLWVLAGSVCMFLSVYLYLI